MIGEERVSEIWNRNLELIESPKSEFAEVANFFLLERSSYFLRKHDSQGNYLRLSQDLYIYPFSPTWQISN